MGRLWSLSLLKVQFADGFLLFFPHIDRSGQREPNSIGKVERFFWLKVNDKLQFEMLGSEQSIRTRLDPDYSLPFCQVDVFDAEISGEKVDMAASTGFKIVLCVC